MDDIRVFGVPSANNAPVLAAIESSVLAYAEGSGAVNITSTLTVTDSDDTDQEGAGCWRSLHVELPAAGGCRAGGVG